MTALDHLRAAGCRVRLSGPDGLHLRVPTGRDDLVAFARTRKPEIIAALRAEQQSTTCPACGGTGDIGVPGRPGHLRGGCWPCSGSGRCRHGLADALARFAGLGQARAKKENAGR